MIGADRVPFRLARARELGFDDVIDVSKKRCAEALKNLTGEPSADIVVVCPNSMEALKEGLSVAGQGGTLLMFTPVRPGEFLTVDPNELYFKDISIVTSYSCGPADTADALELVGHGNLKGEKLITHRFPIEDFDAAFSAVAAGRTGKVLLEW